MSEQDAAAVVQAYWKRLWHERDLRAVDELMGEHYVRHSANGNLVRTHRDVTQDMARYLRSLSGVRVTIEDQVESGGTVWTRVTMRAVNIETETQVVIAWLHVARVEGGRIVEAWSLNAPVDWSARPH